MCRPITPGGDSPCSRRRARLVTAVKNRDLRQTMIEAGKGILEAAQLREKTALEDDLRDLENEGRDDGE